MAKSTWIILAAVITGFHGETTSDTRRHESEDGGNSALGSEEGSFWGKATHGSTSSDVWTTHQQNGFSTTISDVTEDVVKYILPVPTKSSSNKSNLTNMALTGTTTISEDVTTPPHCHEPGIVKDEDVKCVNDNSCSGHCFNEFKITSCRCDMECLLFGDCCFDFFPICLNMSAAEIIGVDVKSSKEDFSQFPFANSGITSKDNARFVPACKKPIPKALSSGALPDFIEVSGCLECSAVETSSVAQYTWGYIMVHKCPDTWTNPKVRKQCETPRSVSFNNPPVHDKLHSRLSYRNIYCAQCHGRSYFNLEPWPLDLSCPERENLGELIKERRYVHDCCKASFRQMSDSYYHPKDCIVSVITDADKTESATWKSKCLEKELVSVFSTQTLTVPDTVPPLPLEGWGLGLFGALFQSQNEVNSPNFLSNANDKRIAGRAISASDLTNGAGDVTAAQCDGRTSTGAPYQYESELTSWCQLYNTLTLNLTQRKSGCRCPVYEMGEKIPFIPSVYDGTEIVMVPISAVFTLDPRIGVKTVYTLKGFESRTEDVVPETCDPGEIFMTFTEQCTPFPPDNTFPPEGNYDAIATLEVKAKIYEKQPVSYSMDSTVIRNFFWCFVRVNQQGGFFRGIDVDMFQTEWEFTTKRKTNSHEGSVPMDHFGNYLRVSRVERNKNSSSPTCLGIMQRTFTTYLEDNNWTSSRWFEREAIAFLLFKSERSKDLSYLFHNLRRVTGQLYLEESSNTVFAFNSVVMRNFNHSKGYICVGELQAVDVPDIFLNSYGRSQLVDSAKPKTWYKHSMVTDTFIYEPNVPAKWESGGVFCELPRGKNCSLWLGVPQSQRKVLDIGLVVQIKGYLYKIHDSIDAGDLLLVCNDSLVEVAKSESSKFNQLEVMLNYVGFVVSLLGLFLTFATYCLFRVLRNVPGMLVMSLSAFMFAAILMWVVGAGGVTDEFVCSIMAAVLHFLWLSTFLWINTLAVDVSRAFSSDGTMNTLSNRGKKKRYLVYMAYVIGVSMLVVGGTILTGFIEKPESAFNGVYGENRFCFVRPDIAVYVFYCPVGCTLFINLCLFVKSVRGIRVVSKLSKHAKLRVDHQWNVFLFAKLSLVLGLSWLLFFLLGHLDNPVVRMFCGTVNSLQGIFVFAVFVCNRRILKLYLKMLHGRGERNVASDSTAVNNHNNENPVELD